MRQRIGVASASGIFLAEYLLLSANHHRNVTVELCR